MPTKGLRIATDVAGARPPYGHVMHNHSMKMMWGCAAIVALVIILAVANGNAGFVLFAAPCMLMMGAMVWMMVRGMGGGGHHK